MPLNSCAKVSGPAPQAVRRSVPVKVCWQDRRRVQNLAHLSTGWHFGEAQVLIYRPNDPPLSGFSRIGEVILAIIEWNSCIKCYTKSPLRGGQARYKSPRRLGQVSRI